MGEDAVSLLLENYNAVIFGIANVHKAFRLTVVVGRSGYAKALGLIECLIVTVFINVALNNALCLIVLIKEYYTVVSGIGDVNICIGIGIHVLRSGKLCYG